MNRRTFLRTGGAVVALAGLAEPVPSSPSSKSGLRQSGSARTGPESGFVSRGGPRTLRIPATLQADAFASSSGADARYHALVHEEGSAAGKALLTTPYPDGDVARQLRASGARDGGGVPMSAWTLRRLPLVPAPDRRVEGSPLTVMVEWEGWGAPRELAQLLQDPGGRGVELRFGGNEDQDHHWESGCIVCLFSCPGGVISNARYSIRDHVREVTRFSPAADLPPEGTEVTVVLKLV